MWLFDPKQRGLDVVIELAELEEDLDTEDAAMIAKSNDTDSDDMGMDNIDGWVSSLGLLR